MPIVHPEYRNQCINGQLYVDVYMKRHAYIYMVLLGVLLSTHTQAQNRPYIDDRLVHFGFSLGINFMSFGVTDSQTEIDGEIYHARVSSMLPGFSVGFITDLRLSRHLSLRFTPGMQFSSRSITYKTESGYFPNKKSAKTEVLAIPITIPLYLKWAAEREGNYRPYLIGGGGAACNVSLDREKPVLLKRWDYFVEIGFGCDLYFRWFKWCPEITYRIGFANQLAPVDGRNELPIDDEFYTRAIDKLLNRAIVLTFNFE